MLGGVPELGTVERLGEPASLQSALVVSRPRPMGDRQPSREQAAGGHVTMVRAEACLSRVGCGVRSGPTNHGRFEHGRFEAPTQEANPQVRAHPTKRAPSPAGAWGGGRSKRVTVVEPSTLSPEIFSGKNGPRAAKSTFPCRNQVAIVATVAW